MTIDMNSLPSFGKCARDEAWAVNVAGTRHVLDAARAGGVGRVVVFSSAAVYSHDRPTLVTESTPVRPGAVSP